jgi:antitoxin MazE
MTTHISQWGNSLGIRLPKFLGEKLNLKKGMKVSLYEEDGKIIIEKTQQYSLDELLSIKKSCPYKEIDTGSNVGNEQW